VHNDRRLDGPLIRDRSACTTRACTSEISPSISSRISCSSERCGVRSILSATSWRVYEVCSATLFALPVACVEIWPVGNGIFCPTERLAFT